MCQLKGVMVKFFKINNWLSFGEGLLKNSIFVIKLNVGNSILNWPPPLGPNYIWV